ncbi:MAG: hypothetical protein WA816_07305, partial [Bacteroidales bacterium]
MKTLSQILVLALLTLGSCTSRLYTGTEYDDLYYLPSDKPVAKNNSTVNEQITEGNLKNKDYYDNIYATDTLVSDQYSNAVDYDNQVNNNEYNSNSQGYDYYSDYPYSNRLRMFYGNYFDPYWRDPFYLDYGLGGMGYGLGMGMGYGMGYGYGMGMGYGYGMGMGYGGLYGDYYGYPWWYSGGYYGGYYGNPYFGSAFYTGYPLSYHKSEVSYGRQERPSTISPRWNRDIGGVGSSNRNSYLSTTTSGVGGRNSGLQTATASQRRTVSSVVNSQVNQVNSKSAQDQTKGVYTRSGSAVQRNPANVKPAYNSVSRTYTPSYNNPRMSTRPSYNNSKVSEGISSGVNRNTNSSRVYNNSGSVRQGNQNSYNNVRNNSSGSSGQRKSYSPSGYYAPAGQYRSNSSPRGSASYSLPSRSSYSSGSYGGSSSGSSRSSSSYSSGSSGSESRGSYSSGSSSSSSSG